jgi:hypothetical protein
MSFATSSFAGAPFADLGSTSISVSLTGVSSESQLGSVSLVTNNILSVTGFGLTSTLNSVGVAAGGNISVVAPADQIDFEIGTPIVSGSAPAVTVTGIEAPAEVGSVTALAGANVNVTGLESTWSIGSVDIVASPIVQPTGVSMQFTDGTVVAPAAAILTGEEVTTSLGSVTIESAYNLTGVSMQFADGTPSTSGSAIVEVTGVEMSAITGNMFSTPWANVVTGASNTWTPVAA